MQAPALLQLPLRGLRLQGGWAARRARPAEASRLRAPPSHTLGPLPAGWSGWGCTDASAAQSFSRQLAAALLLTLSNLSFLPAIAVAAVRCYITEASVYTFTMFFSTVTLQRGGGASSLDPLSSSFVLLSSTTRATSPASR